MLAPRVVLEDVGPNANVIALVEEDGRCLYFYLHGAKETGLGVRSCWVRNLRPAPPELERAALQEGRPPMLPASACAHPEGAPLPLPEQLELAWFPSGDGAALLLEGDVLAVIPPAPPGSHEPGLARDCIAPSPLALPLGPPGEHPIFGELVEAVRFWDAWGEESWAQLQGRLLAAYEAELGPHAAYFKTNGDRWPPRFVARFEHEGAHFLGTGGSCVRPQPGLKSGAEAQPARRFELALACSGTVPAGALDPLVAWLGAQANLPWERYSALARGNLLTCGAMPAALGGAKFPALLLLDDPLGAPALSLPPFMGDPVALLWAVPVTAAERELALSRGPEELVAALRRAGVGAVHRDRASAVP